MLQQVTRESISSQTNTSNNDGVGLTIDPNQTDEQVVSHAVYRDRVTIPGWSGLVIAADRTEITSGIDFYNPISNFWYTCPDCGSELDENFVCMNIDCNKQWNEQSANTDLFYLTFALYLEKDDELLYQSGLVEPNKHINSITLSRPLSAGEYDAYLFIQPYKSDMCSKTNSGKVPIKLYVS